MALTGELVDEVIGRKVPFGVVVFDAWYLAEEVVQGFARQRKNQILLLKQNRLLETTSVRLRDANGSPVSLSGAPMAVEELAPLSPTQASRPVPVGGNTYWCFTLGVRLPGAGKVCLVVGFANEKSTGSYVVLVTNRGDWSVAQLFGLDLQRGPTDAFDRDR